MRSQKLAIEARAGEGQPFLAPVTFDGRGRRFDAFEAEGASLIGRLVSPSGQRAYRLRSDRDEVVLNYSFALDPDAPTPKWLWRHDPNPLSTASPQLADFARAIAKPCAAETVRSIADHVATTFHYGPGSGRFTDGRDSVPLVCSKTRGTCIDIHTYFCAALRASGIEAAYVAGIFIGEGSDEATDMHCWVAVRCGDLVEEWDLSHALMTGRSPAPGLTEIAGRRVSLSAGRGLRFAIDGEAFDLSHLALPCDLNGNAFRARATLGLG